MGWPTQFVGRPTAALKVYKELLGASATKPCKALVVRSKETPGGLKCISLTKHYTS